MRQPAIFLDDGGVMNDNQRRGAAWRRLIPQFLVPRLGGEPRAWSDANVPVFTALLHDYERSLVGQPEADYNVFLRGFRLGWLRGMCERVGVAPPADDECIALAAEAHAWITVRVDSALPGVAAAVRALHARGIPLHTASGEPSDELHGYLTGMGVRDCFRRLYGPDLVGVPKEGVPYYERAFADAGVDPRDAVVVDDFPGALRWAAEAGARTVLVRSDRGESDDVDLALDALSDLPVALDRW